MKKEKVLVAASVASMIDQFNMPNIRLLLEMGYEVHVACNLKEGNTCDDRRIRRLVKTLDALHVRLHQWDCPRSILPAWKCYRAYRQLLGLLKRQRFAWIHSQSPVGGALARIAAHGLGIRVAYTAHGFHFYKGAPLQNWLLYYPAEKLLSYWTDMLITVNREDYELAKRNMRAKKVRYIPGVGIDTQAFAGTSGKKQAGSEGENAGVLPGHHKFCEKYRIPDNARILLSVGELNEGKNHRLAIRALAGMAENDVYYLICGQGKQERRLKAYAASLGVSAYIRMPGYQEQMPCIYQNADIFVFPSKREGMPVSLMEAMAAGLPCVASDIRGNRELVDAHGGGLFSLSQAGALEKKIQRLLEDSRLRAACGAYNAKKISAYDCKIVRQRMRQIYQEMAYKPLVSILIAVYEPNLDWLFRLMRSIRRQTYQHFEILLLDDGSERTPFEEIRRTVAAGLQTNGRLEKKEPADLYRHRVLLKKNTRNEGSNKAFETLACLAHGEYAAFCDQDDIWEPDKLEKLFDALEKEHAVLAYSDMSVIDESGAMRCKSLRFMRRGLRFLHGDGLTAYYLADNCTAGCSMLVQTEIVKKAVPFWTGVYCDQWIAACAAAYGAIAFVPKPLVRYRRHRGNQTGTLGEVTSRQAYFEKRILPMYRMVQELRARGIHYPNEQEMLAFAKARRNGDAIGILKYSRFSRKYAYFDLVMLWMPEIFYAWLRAAKGNTGKPVFRQSTRRDSRDEDFVFGAGLL